MGTKTKTRAREEQIADSIARVATPDSMKIDVPADFEKAKALACYLRYRDSLNSVQTKRTIDLIRGNSTMLRGLNSNQSANLVNAAFYTVQAGFDPIAYENANPDVDFAVDRVIAYHNARMRANPRYTGG